MKNVIKFILSFICYLAFIPGVLALTIFTTWYLLPAFQTTDLGILFRDFVGADSIALMFIIIGAICVFLFMFGKLFTVIKNSKALNFYTHLLTWLLAIALVAEAGYSFVASSAIQAAAIELNLVRKIGILACGVSMLLYAIIAPKVRILVNRKIQAYDTAKELNANGRSSVVWMQILKCFDFICPELFLLIALCFAFNWEVSLYFIFLICAFVIPIIGNMVCDGRVKKEAVRKEQEKQDAQVNATAEAVADILAQRGNP